MSWWRVDDKLHGHRKVRRALRTEARRRDVAPMGLWALAGSWCADNLTDGFVPADELDRWDDNPEPLAARLVDAGLWEPAEVEGERGYRFHDWTVKNPDARSEMLRREAESDGGKQGNHTRWHAKRGITDPECSFCIAPESGTRFAPDVPPDSGGNPTPESPANPPSPFPTQPDTSFPAPAAPAKRPAATRGTRIPENFEADTAMRAWATETCPLVNGGRETANFRDYWSAASGQSAVKLDWVKAWRTWMRRAQTDAERRPGATPIRPASSGPDRKAWIR